MSDVVWYGITIVLFVASLACAAYSGWQVFAPMRFRRIRVIWLVSESLRVRADTWYWRVILLLGTANCMGITLTIAAEMTNRSALSGLGMVVILIGDIIALAGVAVVIYYDRRARDARRRELESTATIC